MSDYSFADLLPYKKDKTITSIKEELALLKVIIFLCNSMVEAFYAFQERKYTCFDAQVSENLCQVRAYQLIQYSKIEPKYYAKTFIRTISKIESVKIQASNMLLEHDIILERTGYNKSWLLMDFLSSNNLSLILEEIEYFLTQSYILSKYKYDRGIEYRTGHRIDYSFLREVGIESNSLAIKITHKMQRNISRLSCEFIKNLTIKINASKERIRLINKLYFMDEVGRHLISSYEATKAILAHAYLMEETVKVKVMQIFENRINEIEFFVELSTENVYFIPSNRYNCLCFIGVVRYTKWSTESKEKYISRFLKVGFREIILANMAYHPQFSGKLLSDKKKNPYMQILEKDRRFSIYKRKAEECFIEHKNLALRIGCAAQNPSLFLLTHIRCDDFNLSNELDGFEKQNHYDFMA